MTAFQRLRNEGYLNQDVLDLGELIVSDDKEIKIVVGYCHSVSCNHKRELSRGRPVILGAVQKCCPRCDAVIKLWENVTERDAEKIRARMQKWDLQDGPASSTLRVNTPRTHGKEA